MCCSCVFPGVHLWAGAMGDSKPQGTCSRISPLQASGLGLRLCLRVPAAQAVGVTTALMPGEGVCAVLSHRTVAGQLSQVASTSMYRTVTMSRCCWWGCCEVRESKARSVESQF